MVAIISNAFEDGLMKLTQTHKIVTLSSHQESLGMSKNHLVSCTKASSEQRKRVSVVSKANGFHRFVKLHVFQIMLIFPDIEHIVSILCVWFSHTRSLKDTLLKGSMICRETDYINLKLFVILRMALINHPNAFRQKLQEDRIRDIVYTMRIERLFSFI